jgi:hypothetical protein
LGRFGHSYSWLKLFFHYYSDHYFHHYFYLHLNSHPHHHVGGGLNLDL